MMAVGRFDYLSGSEVDQARQSDRTVSRWATRQHGVVTRRQLLSVGLTSREIQRRLEAGRLHLAHRGVYWAGHKAVTQHGRWLAAVLACGDHAVLSHRFAAALWGIMRAPEGRVEVIVGRSGRGRRPGIALHRSSTLSKEHRTIRHGIPVTTVTRTLFDLAAVVSPTQLRRAVEEADRLELLDVEALATTCERNSGRRGTGRLRELLIGHRNGPTETRSALEHRFRRLCEGAGLPPPAVNVMVHGIEVDLLWRRQWLVIELDGYAYHRGRAAFERDRRRDAMLTLAGYRVIRVTHRRLMDEPTTVLGELRSALGRAHDAPGRFDNPGGSEVHRSAGS
jgi:hypothetical protein